MAKIRGIILLANKLELELFIIRIYDNSITLYSNTFNRKLIIYEIFIKDLFNIRRLLAIANVPYIGD